MSEEFHPGLLRISEKTDLDNNVQIHLPTIQNVLKKTRSGNLEGMLFHGAILHALLIPS